ncbi:YcxB family protein [Streptomyces lydicus]|uniref:YcxB family protein n=1 Tax=Streptomyces lydicus TaxID=47763 RepID=UPI001010880E|nr:YcxB family protein [Streptomyces lydicus]MCZ1005509.1 YcxB family protein [Streptomyces lydicus]
MDISATFHLTTREYRGAIRNSPTIRGMLIICALMVVVGLISLPSDRPAMIPFCVGLGLPVFLEVVVRLAPRRSAALFAEPWTVRVTEETFTLRTAVSKAEIGWDAYREAWERSGFWFVRQISGASSFIPKRALDDAQQAELAEFFARRLPPHKIRWYRPRSWR